MPYRSLECFEVTQGRVRPLYLGPEAAPIAESVIAAHDVAVGGTVATLERALAAAPLLRAQSAGLISGLRRVAAEHLATCPPRGPDPERVREAVFEASEGLAHHDAETAFEVASETLGLGVECLAGALHADLPSKRLIVGWKRRPHPGELIGLYNFRLVQDLIRRALSVRWEGDAPLRAIHRVAKLGGLILEVLRLPAVANGDEARLALELTGPTAIFRKTTLYGDALARFLCAAVLGSRFQLEARVVLGGKEASLTITERDPIITPHRPHRRFDSALEARFEEDFAALDSRWTIRREERMIPLGRSVFFPDFTFRLREGRGPTVDLEILGFWTGDYVARKLRVFERLRGSGDRLIVCADERLRADAGGSPVGVIPFRRRVDARSVLGALERLAAEG